MLEAPHVAIDIVARPSGAVFEPDTLTIAAGAMLIWTNRTSQSQTLQAGRRVITLAPTGQDGAVAMTAALHGPAELPAALRSNPAAIVTISDGEGP